MRKLMLRWEGLVVYLVVLVLTLLVFHAKFSFKVLDVNYYEWLMSFGDTTTEYLSWQFYRNTPWGFPVIGTMSGYFYPTVTGVGMTGAIPLLAVPMKVLSPWLSPDFQYFGWWFLACYLLQGYFGVRLLRALGVRNAFGLIVGAMFFVLSPSLMYRTGHMNLCAHWLILWGLEIYYSEAGLGVKVRRQWLLVVVTAMVHQYLLLMVFGLGFAVIWKACKSFGSRKQFWGRVLAYNVANLASAGVVWYLMGNFNTRLDIMSNDGFGFYSSNLNTFINSMKRGRILPSLKNATEGQYEGFAYLGAGMLAILLLCFVYRISKRRRLGLRDEEGQRVGNGVVWLVGSLLAVFAFSYTVTWGDRTVMTYHSWMNNGVFRYITTSFRSSGRFIWVLQYLIMGNALGYFWRMDLRGYLKVGLFGALGAVQYYDMGPGIVWEREFLKLDGIEKPIRMTLWEDITKGAKRIVAYPPYEWTYKEYLDYAWFGKVASHNHVAITTGYLARPDMGLIMGYNDTLNVRLRRGGLGDEDSSVFVVKKGMLHAFLPVLRKGLVKIYLVEGYGLVVPVGLGKGMDVEGILKRNGIPIEGLPKNGEGMIGLKDYLLDHENDLELIVTKGDVKRGLCWEVLDYLRKKGSHIDDLPNNAPYVAALYGGKLIMERIGGDKDMESVIRDSLPGGVILKENIVLKSVKDRGDAMPSVLIGGKTSYVGARGMNVVTYDRNLVLLKHILFQAGEVCWGYE